jgi:hypothetical protein
MTNHINPPEEQQMSALQAQSHHVVRIFVTDHAGTRDAGEARVHKSRACINCIHDGARDADWQADDGVGKFGRCMNGVGAADDPDKASQWCAEHQTAAEFEAGVHRPNVPVFTVVEGGAA